MSLTLSKACQSFLGFMRGVGKSELTIESYARDLKTFQQYVRKQSRMSRDLKLQEIVRPYLEAYSSYLKADGYKTNTRRRKLLTVRRLYRYLLKRKQIRVNLASQLPVPDKLERIPSVVDFDVLLQAVKGLRAAEEMECRNRLLLWFLAETACQVTEVQKVRLGDFVKTKGQWSVCIYSKNQPRHLLVSTPLKTEIDRYLKMRGDENAETFVFKPLSPRNIQLIVKDFRRHFGSEVAGLNKKAPIMPKTFRQSAALKWAKSGETISIIQKKLGLKTPYALRGYLPLLK